LAYGQTTALELLCHGSFPTVLGGQRTAALDLIDFGLPAHRE
jgi:hypothetical protein